MNLNYEKQAVGDINNDPILLSIGAVTGEVSLRITKKIQCHPIYLQVASHFNSEKLFFYFQRCVALEVRPYIEQLFIESRYGKINDNTRSGRKEISIPSYGIFSLFKEICQNDEIPICQRFREGLIDRKYREMRGMGKRLIGKWNRLWNTYNFANESKIDVKIAVHFAEGIDLQRRCDIVWLPNSGIDYKHILVYFDHRNVFGKPIPDYVIKELDEMGIQWVAIEKGMVCGREYEYWEPPRTPAPKWLRALKARASDPVGKWIVWYARKLQREVYFWKSFYQTFNVKLLFLPNEADSEGIAQGIAFDIMGEEGGFVIGKQRSEVLRDPLSMLAGVHTKDIVFIWNCGAEKYFKREYNYTQAQVVTGYPNDMNFFNRNVDMRNVRRQLNDKGVKFIIALFDNVFFPKLRDSYEVERFYHGFLNWILKDNTLGIVIKPKKPKLLKQLTGILPLLDKAKATGRCILFDKDISQLTYDSARIADMSVGIKISSAVTEVVIAGCRGIHYYDSLPRWNDYYKWGYEKLVFDDLDRMIDAIKKYKENPAGHQDLGNWTPYLHLLDPFRDGRAGERMGTYLRQCLEGFLQGLHRDDVLTRVNNRYAEKWGQDKVADMRKYC